MLNHIVPFAVRLVESGWLSLLDYLAAHVLLCLVPAFFIAGALSALIPKETVTRYLGPRAPKVISYPAAALGGFVLAVCSCTILPLFAGIWKRGAGLGPAITFLFVGPAINILAIAYTGAAIGMDIALARIVLSIAFGIVIGLIMAAVFKNGETVADDDLFTAKAQIRPVIWFFFALLVATLIAGTLQVEWLTRTWFSLTLPWDIPLTFLSLLDQLHLTVQGLSLIGMLILIALAAYAGLRNVLEKISGWTWITLALVIVTMLIAAPAVQTTSSVVIGFTGRFIFITLLLIALSVIATRGLQHDELQSWLWETWRFVTQIFPLLIVGVFIAGMVKVLIPQEWIRTLAGRNTLWANLLAVAFGVFMYFPTLVEVPIARMFLDLGMHRGPLLAYLLADPELSVQSILVTSTIPGRKRTALYVALVASFSTLAGYL
ncbi:MAG: permease, partial [Chloroflexi bacterium]|nr:permease [Chloroflexota bacterium]